MIQSLLAHASEWAWGGGNGGPEVTPDICLSSLPFFTGPCLSSLITKLIGLAIIAGACLNKLPVLLSVRSNQSVAGFATSAIYGEVIMYSNSVNYGVLRGNPFTAFGENAVVLFQTLILVTMVWRYKDDPVIPTSMKLLALLCYVLYVVVVQTLLAPDLHYLLMAANWPALLVAKGTQIVETNRVKHTGSQSIITITMNFGGSMIRIVTTIIEIGWDLALLSGYALSVGLNLVMLVQYLVYKSNTDKFLEGLQKKKKE